MDKELTIMIQNLQAATKVAMDLYNRSLAELPSEKREAIKNISTDQPIEQVIKKIYDALSN